MKIDLANTTVTESNVLDIEEVEMKFSESALPHLTRMFVNLYNNPDEAVYREILFNAIDATKKSGSDEKIEVYLPTNETPVLTIIDKGVGMSLEDLKRNSQFGGTDKNGENDSVGGFGLGFKSPLSITSQFSVESVKDGDRTVVTISNSEDGICRMSVLLREETDLPNGTTVSVPVKNVYEMRQVAERYTKYVPDMIIYFNRNEYPYFSAQKHYTTYKSVFEGFYDANEYYKQHMTIVMGGVPYNVSYDDLGFHVPELKNLFKGHYILEAPIGSITLSPNREGVQFNQKTKDTVKELLLGKLKDFLEEFETTINNADTFAEALKIWAKSTAVPFIRDGMDWKGISIGYSGTYLGTWKREMEDLIGNKITKSFPHKLVRITSEKTDPTISRIPVTEKKVLFVEPHEDVKTSRFTYLIRQYFLKNDLSFDDMFVYRTESPIKEYTTYRTEEVINVNDDGNNLLVDVLEHLGQDYEVISISDIKKDLEGWKPAKKEGAEDKTRVKYLDREVSFLSDDSGVLRYSTKTISDIVGDGNKKLGIYQSVSNKDEHVNMNGFSTEDFNKYMESNHNVDNLDGVIILKNNAKPEVLEKNTKKFGNTYVVIQDFYSIVEHSKIDKISEILDKDISLKTLLNWTYNYIKEMDRDYGKINDTDIRFILDTGTESFSEDEINFLQKVRVRDSKEFKAIVVNFGVQSLGYTPEYSERLVDRSGYYNIYTTMAELTGRKLSDAMDKYPLADQDFKKETLEYMNMLFDQKHNN